MFGGQRLKRTRISHCIPAFEHLSVLCDGQRVHLPWGHSKGKWATAEETAYPLGLCTAWVQQFLQQMKLCGVILPTLSMKDVTNHDDVAFSRAFGGKQPKGNAFRLRFLNLLPGKITYPKIRVFPKNRCMLANPVFTTYGLC